MHRYKCNDYYRYMINCSLFCCLCLYTSIDNHCQQSTTISHQPPRNIQKSNKKPGALGIPELSINSSSTSPLVLQATTPKHHLACQTTTTTTSPADLTQGAPPTQPTNHPVAPLSHRTHYPDHPSTRKSGVSFGIPSP